jgi:hypothetical protein
MTILFLSMISIYVKKTTVKYRQNCAFQRGVTDTKADLEADATRPV